MKHEQNFLVSTLSGLMSFIISFFLYGNLIGAMFVSAPITFVLCLAFCYADDYFLGKTKEPE